MRPFTLFLGTTALAAAMPVLHAAPVADWPGYNRNVASERFRRSTPSGPRMPAP